MIRLTDALEKAFLKRVHSDIRKSVRSNHLAQGLLVKDATLLSDFQLELEDSVRLLKQNVVSKRYRPQNKTIIRAAKGTGLRRPLTFLQHDDAILLAALSRAARNGINATMRDWVSFGRADNEKPRSRGPQVRLDLEPESGSWFFEWLRYRGLLRLIEGDTRKLLVVSDVANFFPHLDLEILRAAFDRAGFLDEDGTNLLFYLLDQLLDRDGYAPRSKLGLPQDPYDASRVLAHFYLTTLDDELDHEGKTGRYTRWVDDIAISVKDEIEGASVIARIQDSLGRIGLSPNTTKTKILTKDEFRESHLERFNGFLDVVRRKTDMHTVDPPFRKTFDVWFRRFLNEPQSGEWVRVLRRFYTESRRMESGRIGSLAAAHLRAYPAETARILDYMAYRPADENGALVGVVFDLLRERARLYEDVQILCYEWLLAASFDNDVVLRSYVTSQCLQHLAGVGSFSQPIPYVRGLICFVALKFGASNALPFIYSSFSTDGDMDPGFSTNALYVLSSAAQFRDRAWACADHLRDAQVARLRRFIAAVVVGDKRAGGIALGLVSHSRTSHPERYVLHGRALPMLYLLKSTGHFSSQLSVIQKQDRQLLEKQNPRLRDSVMESHY